MKPTLVIAQTVIVRIKLDLVGAANASERKQSAKKNATIMITGGWIPSGLDGIASKLAKAKSVERLMLCLSPRATKPRKNWHEY